MLASAESKLSKPRTVFLGWGILACASASGFEANILASAEAECVEAEAKDNVTRPRPKYFSMYFGHVYSGRGRSPWAKLALSGK